MNEASLPSRRTRGARSIIRAAVERLEVRRLLASIMVTTTADDITPNDGAVSLREAITAVNAGNSLGDPNILAQNPGAFGANDTINFNIPGSGTQSVSVGASGNGALPALTKPVTINGYSEAGASPNTLANGGNAKVLIELNGANAGANADGLRLAAGSGGSTVEGLAVNRFSANGIELQSNGNIVQGNLVGTNPQGNAAEPNQVDGIRVSSSSNNTIGGTTPAARNVASGNAIDGIHVVGTPALPATGNTVEGNFVGVNAAGTGSVGIKPNGGAAGSPSGNSFFGIEISGGNNNTVGGTAAGARNVVGLNAAGIEVDDGGQGNLIEGNFSGVGADGVTPVGNNLHGVVLRSDGNLPPPLGPGNANEPPVKNNTVGGTAAGAGNLVEFNGTGGVAVFGNPGQNNATQAQNNGNAILGNSIFENGRSNPTFLLGIDLTNQFTFPKDDGATPNDSAGHGAPNDPNNFQNAPVLTSAAPVSGGGTRISGTLTQSVSPNTTFRVELFANDPDPMNGVPEGQTFLGFANVTTLGNGAGAFSVTVPASVAANQVITATATDPAGNTSEFSAPVAVVAAADLSVTNSAPATVTEGQQYTQTISVTNNGPSDATNVLLTDTRDANTRFVLTSFPGGTITSHDPSGGVETINLGTIHAGATVTGTFTLLARSAGAATNTASAASDVADSVSGNNSQSTNTTIQDADLTATGGRTLHVTEGQTFHGVVGSFTDADPNAGPGNYSAVIHWGDGSQSNGTVSANGSGFDVTGTHAYAHDQTDAITIDITDNNGGSTATDNGSAVVAEAAVSSSGATFAPHHGVTFSGPVGTLADSNSLETLGGAFVGSVNWGDGAVTAATFTYNFTTHKFAVNGSHKYAKAGKFNVKVKITDGPLSTTFTSIANVA